MPQVERREASAFRKTRAAPRKRGYFGAPCGAPLPLALCEGEEGNERGPRVTLKRAAERWLFDKRTGNAGAGGTSVRDPAPPCLAAQTS
jgi:hypothetical protein